MTGASFHRDNHFVPQMYLRGWSSSPGKVWTYRSLVSNPRVPLWKESSIRGVAFHQHLYTRLAAGGETDELERWFDREFEAPAQEALSKATSDQRLTPADWKRLVRFLAALDVRTPARLAEHFQRWPTELPELLNRTLTDSVAKLEAAKASGEPFPTLPALPEGDRFPIRITTEARPDEEYGTIEAAILAGRSLWLAHMPRLLTKTAEVLHGHQWTILSPPEGLTWFTSDDPVLRLNFSSIDRYDFGGGWNRRGTDIFLPLGPRHLLFTTVGTQPPRRGDIVPKVRADLIRRFVAEHAHRMIFASDCDGEVPRLRERVVDATALREETERWRGWNDEQAAAERDFRRSE
jgi:hypothetical protein